MNLDGILPFARILLEKTVKPGSIAIDGTVGNGHDTLFLAKLVGENGHVYGFDIQQPAIINTTERLTKAGVLQRVTLFHKGHEEITSSIPKERFGKIDGAIFNLGYLPGGNKEIVTRPETTISAMKQLLEILSPGGIIVLVIYHGHEEGAREKEEVLQFVKNLDQKKAHVLKYEFLNQINNPPFIVAIEKREN